MTRHRLVVLTQIVLLAVSPCLALASTDGGRVPTIDDLLTLKSAGGAQISPDGRWVAYTTTETDFKQDAYITQVWLVNAANGKSLQLTRGDKPSGNPQWSPNGQHLGWSAGSPSEIQMAPISGGAVKMWTIGRQPVFLKNFSPDGRYLMGESANDKEPIAQGVQNYLSLKQFFLFDLQSKTIQPPISLWAYSTLWMPGSHRLLAAGPAGVTSLDPATGEYEWLGSWQRCQLRR